MKNICKTHLWLPNCQFEVVSTIEKALKPKTGLALLFAASSVTDVVLPTYHQGPGTLGGILKTKSKPASIHNFNTLLINNTYYKNTTGFASSKHLLYNFMLLNRVLLQPDIYPVNNACGKINVEQNKQDKHGIVSRLVTLNYCDL